MLRLVNPAIREFDILFPRADLDSVLQLGRCLADIFSSMKNLEVLSVQVLYPAPLLDMESLPRLHPHLRRLEVGPDAYTAIDHLRPLSALPHLEHLTICLGARGPPNLHITLPRLRSLAVYCGFDIVGMLLAHVDAPGLQAFSLTETHRNSNDMSQELPNHLRTLVANCPSLTAFEWSSSQDWAYRMGYRGRLNAGVPLAELIAPLLAHHPMRRLSVWLHDPVVPLTPADFRAIAEAWPNLKSLSLYGAGGEDGEARFADLESVMAFARHCPQLRSLDVPVVQLDPPCDEAAVAKDSEVAHGVRVRAPHWLRELVVGQVDMAGSANANGDSGEDEEQQRDRKQVGIVKLRGLMENVFPSASIRYRY
ncbi:hypothetical protein GSI_11529 [Ganoderma sinense ZZ0214-1]|uniref:Uncharacterized protein n=1 Tax=Ganoderma sinense ZZ0214-1 TaxID=1077348 RepID=A0A2G8RW90_9APHY|nr:hypothetical protein GSI_11529 [Ganoderma sinense ZZ0214-1]